MAYALPEVKKFALTNIVLQKYVPSTWTDMSPETAVKRVELSSYSEEYKTVVNKIKLTLPVAVSRVERIQNPYLWGAYLLNKQQNNLLTEKQLFHATAQSNIDSIATNNFDWRRTVRSKFGKGVSFSPSAAYADKYCNMRTGTQRALILAKVAVGATYPGSQFSDLPLTGYDTTTGNSGKVYVKYGDNEYYPEYVAYYVNNNPHTGRRGNRFVFNIDDLDLWDLLNV